MVSELDVKRMKTLEPSFGDGAILLPVARGLAHAAIKYTRATKSKKTAAEIVDDNLYGIELDPELYEATVSKIREELYDIYGLIVSLPNLVCADALESDWSDFDYIIGNPPYVRIHNIQKDDRTKIKSSGSIYGTSDLYVAFLQHFSQKMRQGTGRLCFITPNSWLRNASQKSFRQELINSNKLEKFRDFGSEKVFKGFNTYTAVTTLSEAHKDAVGAVVGGLSLSVPYESLKALRGAPIAFNDGSLVVPSEVTLGTICRAHNGVCTLGNKLFLITDEDIEKFSLETVFIQDAIKASHNTKNPVEKIFFPYVFSAEGKAVPITEEEFCSSSPNLYSFMKLRKKELETRAVDKGALWFHYGRSQALHSINKTRLAVSVILGPANTRLLWRKIPPMTVLYYGLYVIPDESSMEESQLMKVLESESLRSHVESLARTWGGNYKSFSSKILNNFDMTKYVTGDKTHG